MRSAPLLLATLLGSCNALPTSDLPATPQRPTLSSDTSTTAESSFEVEVGGAWDPDDSFATPMSLKYGAGPRTEVFVSGSPVVVLQAPGDDQMGPSDLALGIRHRLVDEVGSRPSAAVQSTVVLPTANEDEGLGTGEVGASFAGIVTKSMDGWGLTGFYSLDFLGDPAGGTDLGHSVALASGLPLADGVSAFGEVAGVFVPENDADQAFTTLGLTYSRTPSTVLDLAVVVGLDSDAPDLQVLLGFTSNLGRPRAD